MLICRDGNIDEYKWVNFKDNGKEIYRHQNCSTYEEIKWTTGDTEHISVYLNVHFEKLI